MMEITIPRLDFLTALKEELKADNSFQEMVQKVLQNPTIFDKFQLADGLFFLRESYILPRVLVSNNFYWKSSTLLLLEDTVVFTKLMVVCVRMFIGQECKKMWQNTLNHV